MIKPWHGKVVCWADRIRLAGAMVLAAGTGWSLAVVNAGAGMILIGMLPRIRELANIPGIISGSMFSIWCSLSVIITAFMINGDPARHIGILYFWFVIPALGLGLPEAFAKKWLPNILLGSVGVGVALAGAAWFIGTNPENPLKISWSGDSFQRVGGTLGSCLVFAVMLACVSPVFFPSRSQRPAWRNWMGSGMIAFGQIVALTRGPMLAWFAALGVWALVGWGKRYAGRILLVGMLIVGLTGAAFWFFRPDVRQLGNERFNIWQVAWSIAQDHPWLGSGGRKAYQEEFTPRYLALLENGGTLYSSVVESRNPHAHNLEMILLAEHGFPSLFFYLGFLASLAWFCWKGRMHDPQAAARGLAVLAAWFVAGQFDNAIGQAERSHAFSLAFVLVTWPLLQARLGRSTTISSAVVVPNSTGDGNVAS